MGPQDRTGWLAALDGTPGPAVLACGLEPDEVALVAVTDIEPYLTATKDHLLAGYDAASPPGLP